MPTVEIITKYIIADRKVYVCEKFAQIKCQYIVYILLYFSHVVDVAPVAGHE